MDAPKAPSATSPKEENARLDQALEDLFACEAQSVSLIHCPNPTRERALIKDLAQRARDRRFVTAEVSLREHSLESPDGLLREILDHLTPPKESRPRGFLWLLDAFYDAHQKNAAQEFAKAAAAEGADGDLTALAESYIESEEPAGKPLRAYNAWIKGVEAPHKSKTRLVRRALSERTAQRSLNELTRLIRALGYRGVLLLLSEGDALASRTERQREKAYTVLRELVDNFGGSGGAISARVILSGQDALFQGTGSINSVVPLRMRLEIPGGGEPPPPHRSWTTLSLDQHDRRHRKVAPPEEKKGSALTNLIRISEGLPPVDRITQMSVGQEKLDRTIKRLFSLVSKAGSFFSVLVGDYGSGKTHLMMHLAERALEDNRPVFWLNLERTNLDLGNPARHLSRLLEHSVLPLRGQPNAIALARRWTRTDASVEALVARLKEVAEGEGEASIAAKKGLRIAENAKQAGYALENYLVGSDLEQRPGDPSYRRDAYRRTFLWLELLARLENVRGPVILIDEAENMYTSGRAPSTRRTSLRTLAFYCGGALPGTCVVMAMTPSAFEEMKGEARDLLEEAGEMDTTLDLENVERFRKSMWGLKPEPVRPLTKPEREELAQRVRRMHRTVRGAIEVDDWDERVASAIAAHDSPRMLVRALVDHLETAWWRG